MNFQLAICNQRLRLKNDIVPVVIGIDHSCARYLNDGFVFASDVRLLCEIVTTTFICRVASQFAESHPRLPIAPKLRCETKFNAVHRDNLEILASHTGRHNPQFMAVLPAPDHNGAAAAQDSGNGEFEAGPEIPD